MREAAIFTCIMYASMADPWEETLIGRHICLLGRKGSGGNVGIVMVW